VLQKNEKLKTGGEDFLGSLRLSFKLQKKKMKKLTAKKLNKE
jgi:hypothetical protein